VQVRGERATVVRVNPEAFDTDLRPDALDADRPRPVETPWGSFALYKIGARIFAAQSFCPHLEGPLFQGTVSGTEVVCPWHQWRFSLETGLRTDLFGRHRCELDALMTCAVSFSASGTIVLARPTKPSRA
jgi:nitrite reductase/ring-hydroxylating ferredoxin subunit